jgi:hypothetical protein
LPALLPTGLAFLFELGKFLLGFASTVTLGFRTRDHIFVLFKTLTSLEMVPPLQ